MSKIRVAIETLGCKVNQAETESLIRRLNAAGYQIVPSDTEADVYILNTCTVTHTADRKSRHWLRMTRRRYPSALLVATGCYAEHAVKELSKIEGVGLVVGNKEKAQLVDILDRSLSLQQKVIQRNHLDFSGQITPPIPNLNSGLRRNDSNTELFEGMFRNRTFIKVQDGCRNFCTYCIVPFVRSRENSLPAEQVIKEITNRQNEDYREVVITGVEVGTYDDNGLDLKGLLEKVLAETDIERIRLSSLQPPEITPDLLGLWQNPRLCRHFHLALQSGSDGVLKRMKRHYSTDDYAKAVSLIRKAIPDVAITTDVIVGFPGETEQEFEEGYEFCRKMEFARMHIFPYSIRQGTKAAGLPEQVDDKTKKQRTAKMLALADNCIINFSRKYTGKIMTVLFEQEEYKFWSGLTDNYIRVYAESEENLINQIRDVKLVKVWEDGTRGEVLG